MASQSSSCSHDEDDVAVSEPSAPDPSACSTVTVSGEQSMYGQFTWTVALPAAPADKDSLADISKIRQFSEVFEVGGYEWKLEMYPYGDSQSDKTLSVFLCAVDRKQLPGWSQTAHYQIAVVNKDPSKTSTHTGYDIFRGKRDSAWGWSKLINLSKLHDVSQGWVDDEGKITLQATVHVVTHEYMPVNRTYRKSLCGLYYERVLQSYFEPFLKDELQRLDKLCGNSVLHKGFSDFWAALADAKKRALLQITMDEVLLNVKARLFSRDQPATYLAADVIFKAAHECAHGTLSEGAHRSLVGCTSLAVVSGGEGTVLRLERLTPEASSSLNTLHTKRSTDESASAADSPDSPTSSSDQRVMLRTHNGVMRMSNSANFVDVFRAQVADALDNVRALVKHLKPQSCDGTCLEAMGRQMLAVFAMCGMYITNVHPAYHEKLALQLQEDLIREEEEKSLKAKAKKAKQQEKKKKQQEVKAQKRAEEEEAKRKEEEEEKRKKDDAAAKRKAADEEQARKKAESRRKAQEEAERTRKAELEAEDLRAREEAERKAKEEEAARQQRAASQKEEEKEESVPEEEKAKRNHIAAIMRDKTLNPRERQLRIQAILAGKVDVSQTAAEDTPAPPQAGSQRHQQQQQASAPRHHQQQQQQQQQQHHQQHQQHHQQHQSAPMVHPNQQQHHQQGRGMQQQQHHQHQSAPMVHPNQQQQQQQQQQHHQQQQQYGHAQHQQQAQAQQQHALHAGSRSRQGPPLAPPTHGGDLDVEAFALGGINSALQDMARGDVDVMAMATGMMDPPNQNWGVGPHDDQAGIDSQNFAQWDEFGVGGGAQAMPNMYAPFGASTAAPSGGSRLFERWGSRAVASDSSQGGRLG